MGGEWIQLGIRVAHFVSGVPGASGFTLIKPRNLPFFKVVLDLLGTY